MSGPKARLFAGTAILAALSAPSYADQPMSVRSNSLGAQSIQGMTAPKYSRTTPMGGVDYGDDFGNHEAEQDIDMSGFGIYNLKEPTVDRPDMAANKRYVDRTVLAGKDNLGDHTAERNLDMNGHEIRSVGAPTTNGSAANKRYVDDAVAAGKDNLGNHTATQNLDMDNSRIVDVGAPVDPADAATKSYVDSVGLASQDNLGNHTATTVLNMSGQKITNLAAPTAGSDAATKTYVDSANTTINNNLSALTGRKIIAGAGLTGGGDLSADRTLAIDTTWADARYARANRQITAGSGLTGGGSLAANRTLAVDGTVVRTTGAQTIGGAKTFTDGINNGGSRLTNVGTPTANSDATNKGYVDAAISDSVAAAAYTAGNGLTLSARQFAINTGVVATLSGSQTFTGSKTFDSITRHYASSNQVRISKQGTGHGFILNTNGTVLQFLTTADGEAVSGAATALRPLTINATTGRTVIGNGLGVTGGATIAGGINASNERITSVGTPTASADAANKAYVDSQVANAMTNGTYTAGSGVAINASNAISVDGTVVRTSGAQTIAGVKTFSNGINNGGQVLANVGTPTAATHAATKGYVDGLHATSMANGSYTAGTGISISGKVISAAATLVTTDTTQTITGAKTFSAAISMDGQRITNVGDPTASHHAVNRRYLEAQIAAAATAPYTAGSGIDISTSNAISLDATVLRTTGAQTAAGRKTFSDGINNGDKTLTNVGDPTASHHAVNRRYLEAQIAAAATSPYTAGSGLALTGSQFAVDTTVLRTTGNQTIAGRKTFSDGVNNGNMVLTNVATPTTTHHAANKSYVDTQIAAAIPAPYTAGTGVTISTANVVALDTTVLRTTGAQTAAGRKTFSDGISNGDNTLTNVGDPTSSHHAVNRRYLEAQIAAIPEGVAPTRTITTNNGITGGGNLTANRTFGLTGQALALHNLATNGLITRTAAGTVVGRSIAAGTGIAVTNGNGVAGNPTLAVDATVVRTTGNQTISGIKTFDGAARFQGASNQLRLSNEGTLHGIIFNNTGTEFQILTTNSGSAVSGSANARRPFSINAATGAVTIGNGLTVAGGATIAGGINASSARITAVATPTANTDAANKAYVDAQVAGVGGATYTAGSGVSISAADVIALDTTVLRTTGAQTATGKKTFSDGIGNGDKVLTNVATPTATHHAANKSYVDAQIAAIPGGVDSTRTITTNNGITGGGNLSANRTFGLTGNALGLHNLATNGLVTRTAAGAMAARSIAAGAGVAVTNGTGVAGNPTVALSGQALALHSLTANGIIVRTGTGTVAGRSVVAGTAIEVTNGNGVSGNITVKLADNNIRRAGGNANAGVLAYNGTAAGTGGNFDSSTTNPAATLRLNYNGYLYATRFYSSMYLYFSDRNLKENIQTISPAEGIETIRMANPVSYHWKDTGYKALGLIAQEVEEIIPTAVKTNEAGIKSVDYVQMIAPMLAAIQDLDERVQKLEAEKVE